MGRAIHMDTDISKDCPCSRVERPGWAEGGVLGRPRTQSWGFISLLLARSTATELSSRPPPPPGISGLANLSSNSCRRVYVRVESRVCTMLTAGQAYTAT